MWDSELDEGSLCVPGRTLRLAGVRRGAAPAEGRPPEGRIDVENPFGFGLGVAPKSADGKRDLRVVEAPAGKGAFAVVEGALGIGAEASDMGGDGGSCTSTLASGGVVTKGELAVESTSSSVFLSKVGEPSAERSVEMVDK